MAYSAEVLKRARDRLAQMRADRDSENAQRLQEAYQKLPRLKQIDTELRLTMARPPATTPANTTPMAVSGGRVL